MKIKSVVRTPWGDEFEVEELTPTMKHHIEQGVLVLMEDDQPTLFDEEQDDEQGEDPAE